MPLDGSVLRVQGAARARSRLRLVPPPPLRVADLVPGHPDGWVRRYLEAKADWAARTGVIEHHVVSVPGGIVERLPRDWERVSAALAEIAPDAVMLHDPSLWSLGGIAAVKSVGARAIIVHHGGLQPASTGVPGAALVRPVTGRWLRRVAPQADGVMSAVQTWDRLRRHPDVDLAVGIDEAFRPRPAVRRGDHVVLVGRLSRARGVLGLLDAAARSADPWPVRFVGAGPAEDAILRHAERLGIASRVSLHRFVEDRDRLGRIYASAACVVALGPPRGPGLVALEAAASGAHVVVPTGDEAAPTIGALWHPFMRGQTGALLAAVGAARAAPRDLLAAADVAVRFGWEAALVREVRSLEELVR